MSNGWMITWKGGGPPYPTDGSIFRGDTLATLAPGDIAKLTIRIGRDDVPLGDVFSIEPRNDHQRVINLSDLPPLDRIGAGMKSGTLVIWGGAGDDLGASMSGGSIRLRGPAGHRVGGPAPHSDRGMTGGDITIEGIAGDYVGYRMRRGFITVQGQAGRSPGYRMLAGTIAIGKGPFDAPGLEMRRGSVLCLDSTSPVAASPAFSHVGDFDIAEIPALRLMLHEASIAGVNEPALNGKRFRLFTGDRFELNKGEIWQWLS